MTSIVPNRKEQLAERLFQAFTKSKRHRIARLISNPWKLLYPVIIDSIRGRRECRTPTFWGGNIDVILPEPVSTHIWRYGFFEADVSLFLIDNLTEGMTLVDVGGHFGFFTLLGSFLVGEEGKILTFEPTPTTYNQLIKNISLHSSCPNVEAINCAAYSENKEIKFYDYGLEGSAYNSAFMSKTVGGYSYNRKEAIVPGKKIDDLLIEKGIQRVDLVKIDAESSELHVLNGMSHTIDTDRPIIIVEVGDNTAKEIPTSKEVISWLQIRDYGAYEIRDGEIVPHVFRENYEYGNLLFRPEHR